MSNGAQDYNIAAIRQLLLAAFTPEDLRRFCYDRPDLRPVVRRCSPRHSLEDIVDELITYCETYLVFPELLAELQHHNPRQYARFLEPDQFSLPPPPSTPEILTISHPISLHLVRVPAGTFQMGSNTSRDIDAKADELPLHLVHVPEFHIGQYPVTDNQYRAFLEATGYPAPFGFNPRGEGYDHPVVNVSREEAYAFCRWLSRQTRKPFRLPTEAEWEKAARGTDGRIYPWGDDLPDPDRCNFNKCIGHPTAVGRYSPQGDSPYGCADMTGNVLELCVSLYKPYPYQADDGREDWKPRSSRDKPRQNSTSPHDRALAHAIRAHESDEDRVVRGGFWRSGPENVRCAFRNYSKLGSTTRVLSSCGFRVAMGFLL
jgi:formylglycine-generating enzyme required for sulfatase activity